MTIPPNSLWVSEMTALNRRLEDRLTATDHRLGRLAQLLAAVTQLHVALDEAGVRTAIKEIAANLLGSEECALFRGPAPHQLELMDGIGVDPARHVALAADSAVVRQALSQGRPTVAPRDPVLACIPLVRHDTVTGALVLFGLLPQKSAIEPEDYELFDLLSIHAALALHHAELRALGRTEAW